MYIYQMGVVTALWVIVSTWRMAPESPSHYEQRWNTLRIVCSWGNAQQHSMKNQTNNKHIANPCPNGSSAIICEPLSMLSRRALNAISPQWVKQAQSTLAALNSSVSYKAAKGKVIINIHSVTLNQSLSHHTRTQFDTIWGSSETVVTRSLWRSEQWWGYVQNVSFRRTQNWVWP